MESIPVDAPCPRLCYIVKRADFEGFGFNLHAGKMKAGQFIGKVDGDSPAESAGLRQGDRIIEVNGVNVCNENHKQVVQRIKLRPNETELLVVDAAADEFYTSRGITIKSSMPNVIRRKTSIAQPESSSSESEDEPQKRNSSSSASSNDMSNAPSPRLCHVIKWNPNDGFGFHLLADKKRQGQFIGKVDAGSAADAAGLRLGDRIIEINGVNVTSESHQEVVRRIKMKPNETKMLVIDSTGESYYKERNLTIHSNQSNVRYQKTPAQPSRSPINPPIENRPAPAPAPPSTPAPAPAPRLCHVIKWNASEGYGFHLMADKKKPGHFIGKVDQGTPAELAGLRTGDRIVEVNGVNVANQVHKELVLRIKSVANETKLLVVDPETDTYYQQRNINVDGKQSNVEYVRNPATPPGRRHSSSTTSQSSDDGGDDQRRVQLNNQQNGTNRRSQISQHSNSTAQSNYGDYTETLATSQSMTTITIPISRPVSMSTINAAAATGLDLNMSAAELRARLAARKKYDPRRETIELRRKHEIIQTM